MFKRKNIMLRPVKMIGDIGYLLEHSLKGVA